MMELKLEARGENCSPLIFSTQRKINLKIINVAILCECLRPLINRVFFMEGQALA
jgi:hypothetical protein